MNKQFDVESAFNQYFNKVESYGLRSERFFEDVKYAFVKDNPKALIEWMKASFVMGAKAAAIECLTICEELGDNGMDGHYCADKINKTFGVKEWLK